MKRLEIAIDCDDVLIDTTPFLVEEYNRLYGTNVQLKDAHTVGNTQWAAEVDTVLQRLIAIQQSEEFGFLPPSSEAVKAVGALALHHRLHLVTARDGRVLQITKQMLNESFPDQFASIEHVGYGGSKGDICAQLGADVLIDDNKIHIDDAIDKNAELVGIWFGDHIWQDQQDELSRGGILRSKTWSQVQKQIGELADESSGS